MTGNHPFSLCYVNAYRERKEKVEIENHDSGETKEVQLLA